MSQRVLQATAVRCSMLGADLDTHRNDRQKGRAISRHYVVPARKWLRLVRR